jgi:hypothetical protein
MNNLKEENEGGDAIDNKLARYFVAEGGESLKEGWTAISCIIPALENRGYRMRERKKVLDNKYRFVLYAQIEGSEAKGLVTIEAARSIKTRADMNPQQMACFSVWYKQGVSSAGTRSYTKTAEITNTPVQKIYRWAKAYDWKVLAEKKDEEINEKIERELMSQVVEAYQTAIKRQQLFAGRIWQRIFNTLDNLEVSSDWILKFMEYELSLYREGRKPDNGAPEGINLQVVVENNLSKEARNEFLSALGDAAEHKFERG